MASRWDRTEVENKENNDFDLIRASVNLVVAAVVISFATSHKLPLSTTFVTFMVVMGTALADGAWGKACASSRVAGMIAVISGWFITALFAFAMAGFTVSVLYNFKSFGLVALIIMTIFILFKLYRIHNLRTVKA